MSRRRFIRQSFAASAMLVGGGVTSVQLLSPKGLPPQSIELNPTSAKAIEELRKIEVKELADISPIKPIPSVVTPRHIEPVDAISRVLLTEKESVLAPNIAVNTKDVVQPDDSRNLVSVDKASEAWQQRVVRFDENLPGDIFLPEEQIPMLKRVTKRLASVRKYVGYGNFNLLSFDQMLYHARNQDSIGVFTRDELDFLDQVFYQDAKQLGFMGDKVIPELTKVVDTNRVTKVKGSGHFLYQGESEVHFRKIQSILGSDLVLTSGIRGIVKQYHLYLAKAVKTNGNMSRASRSLAPPGYSYHLLGDFDVGQKGMGFSNFTSEFAESDIFKRLTDLGFIKIRYTQNNKMGVRFEPWHIRVV